MALAGHCQWGNAMEAVRSGSILNGTRCCSGHTVHNNHRPVFNASLLIRKLNEKQELNGGVLADYIELTGISGSGCAANDDLEKILGQNKATKFVL